METITIETINRAEASLDILQLKGETQGLTKKENELFEHLKRRIRMYIRSNAEKSLKDM